MLTMSRWERKDGEGGSFSELAFSTPLAYSLTHLVCQRSIETGLVGLSVDDRLRGAGLG